jgi:hypothetical protein
VDNPPSGAGRAPICSRARSAYAYLLPSAHAHVAAQAAARRRAALTGRPQFAVGSRAT